MNSWKKADVEIDGGREKPREFEEFQALPRVLAIKMKNTIYSRYTINPKPIPPLFVQVASRA